MKYNLNNLPNVYWEVKYGLIYTEMFSSYTEAKEVADVAKSLGYTSIAVHLVDTEDNFLNIFGGEDFEIRVYEEDSPYIRKTYGLCR